MSLNKYAIAASDLTKMWILINDGWIQNHHKDVIDDVTYYCLSGAMREVRPWYDNEHIVVCDALSTSIGNKAKWYRPADGRNVGSVGRMIRFNDMSSTTKQQVLDVIDEAIELCKSPIGRFHIRWWMLWHQGN